MKLTNILETYLVNEIRIRINYLADQINHKEKIVMGKDETTRKGTEVKNYLFSALYQVDPQLLNLRFDKLTKVNKKQTNERNFIRNLIKTIN